MKWHIGMRKIYEAIKRSSFYRKYLAEPLKLLADATEQIHNQNLDFSISYGRNDEFGQLCESFEKMRQTLYDNNRRMWNMLEERRLLQASVAHDLRNPIAIIGGYIEYLQKNILQDRISQDKVLHILDNMATASKRLEQYTNSIRDISSLENMETKKPYSQMGKEVVECGYEKRKETQGVPERLDG